MDLCLSITSAFKYLQSRKCEKIWNQNCLKTLPRFWNLITDYLHGRYLNLQKWSSNLWWSKMKYQWCNFNFEHKFFLDSNRKIIYKFCNKTVFILFMIILKLHTVLKRMFQKRNENARPKKFHKTLLWR